MTVQEAESTCQAYSSYFANVNEMKNSREAIFVFSSFDLPWSPAKLKYAFLTLAEELVKNGTINDHFEVMKIMYGTIDGTFKEEANDINDEIARIMKIKDKDKLQIEQIKFQAKFDGINCNRPDSGLAGEVEFQNFIVDLTGRWNEGRK